MSEWKQTVEKVGTLLNAEAEMISGKCIIKKSREIEILADGQYIDFILEMDISFTSPKEKTVAINKAEIFLLPDEFSAFTTVLQTHEIPLPTQYQHRLVENPQIVCVYIESTEPPEHFAERLSAALQAIDCL